MDLLAVNRQYDLMRVRDARDVVQIGLPESNVEEVLGVERKYPCDEKSTTRAERESLDMRVLRSIRFHAIRIRGYRDVACVADGDGADAPGGGEIPLHQHRR